MKIKVKFELEVEVPQEEWIDFLTQYRDIFARNYCGYWLRAVEWDSKLGWLVWEHDENWELPSNVKEVEHNWQRGLAVPKHFYCLNEAMAIKAFEEGVKKWGEDWFENGDAGRYDFVLQLAMLGEHRYG